MKILHTEASPGWGGQEMRIVQEAQGMRLRGHELIFAVQQGGGIVEPLRCQGFLVYELSFRKKDLVKTAWRLFQIIRRHSIALVNTHSSLDSWLGGIVGKVVRKKVVRTRHLSTKIRPGLNSVLLYNLLADCVVTTCDEIVPMIRTQARLSAPRVLSIPTGLDPKKMEIDPSSVAVFRRKFGFEADDLIVGTACLFRGWKGIEDLLHAAKLLEGERRIKFLLVGSGVSEAHFRAVHQKLGLEKSVFFTGHLTPPYTAMAAMDLFALLSWAHEGVSQASLQAAYLEKPLITTGIGGLKEVCIHEKTGLLVPVRSPEEVAEAIMRLAREPRQRREWGREGRLLVERKFLFETMLDKMEEIYGINRRV